MPWLQTLRQHWPEYLIEGWALGMFMISAAVFATLLDAPSSPVHQTIANADMRRALVGIAMGATAMTLIYSPWGQRSGAHMNPAVTLSFWVLGRVRGRDALFYILAQFTGGLLGVLVAAFLLGDPFTSAPVQYAATLPGPGGTGLAFVAEIGISALMMSAVLRCADSAAWASRTGVVAGLLVATFITFEAPWSGMSMNPARSFASAAPAGIWHGLWIYLTAPLLGMLVAATWYRRQLQSGQRGCAKLHHGARQRCIHCGYAGAS